MTEKDNTPGNLLVKERDANHSILDLAQTASSTEEPEEEEEAEEEE